MEEWKSGRMEEWKSGTVEGWKGGRVDEMERRNINRGYRKLTVWEDAIAYYAATCETLRGFPLVLLRVASQQMVSADPIHRNAGEDYC